MNRPCFDSLLYRCPQLPLIGQRAPSLFSLRVSPLRATAGASGQAAALSSCAQTAFVQAPLAQLTSNIRTHLHRAHARSRLFAHFAIDTVSRVKAHRPHHGLSSGLGDAGGYWLDRHRAFYRGAPASPSADSHSRPRLCENALNA
jgi:hypothetical protein